MSREVMFTPLTVANTRSRSASFAGGVTGCSETVTCAATRSAFANSRRAQSFTLAFQLRDDLVFDALEISPSRILFCS